MSRATVVVSYGWAGMEVFRGGSGFVDSSEDGIYWQVAGYRGNAAGVDGALCN